MSLKPLNQEAKLKLQLDTCDLSRQENGEIAVNPLWGIARYYWVMVYGNLFSESQVSGNRLFERCSQ
jgi:hypothetical protein